MFGREGVWRGAGIGAALAFVVVSAGAVSAVEPCSTNCAVLSVGAASGAPGQTVSIPVSFAQGPDDGQAGQGNDEIAAIALTLGIPGLGTETPLQLADCADTDGDGLPDAVTVAAGLAADFRVVVENYQCVNRNRCLCPTESGQTRDNFVNVVVYGPKDLPEGGPVDIPMIPSGELFRIALEIAPGTAAGTIPLHVFAETDDPNQMPKPNFGAFLSVGDKSAKDQTLDNDTSRVTIEDGAVMVTGAACVGDCDGNGMVAINEIILGVNIALGQQDVSACPRFDPNGDGTVTINEIIRGVRNALNGCPQ